MSKKDENRGAVGFGEEEKWKSDVDETNTESSLSLSSSSEPEIDRKVQESPSNKSKTIARVLHHTNSLKKYVAKNTANFFGVNEGNEEDRKYRLWQKRRMRLLERKCGKVKNPKEFVAPQRSSHGKTGSDDVDSPENVEGQVSEGQMTLMAQGVRGDGRHTVSVDGTTTVHDFQQTQHHDEESEEEDFVRKPVYQLGLDGIAFISDTLRKKLSTRHPKRGVDEGGDEAEKIGLKEDLTADARRTERVSGDFANDDVDKGKFKYDTVSGTTLATDIVYLDGSLHEVTDSAPRVRRTRYRGSGTQDITIQNLQSSGTQVIKTQKPQSRSPMDTERSKKDSTQEQHKEVDTFDDYRPYFTYWITCVQIIVLIISLSVYGFGPFGIDRKIKSGSVLVTSLSLQQIEYYEQENFWYGPRPADLIHLGAKFTPCMRKDKLVFEGINKEREVERESACCIRNDQSGCVQTTHDRCSKLLSTWVKWDNKSLGPYLGRDEDQNKLYRMSGSVCGQDPRYCEEPASVEPYQWPDDITKWPICQKQRNRTETLTIRDHMTCENVGRPCCVGVYGECRIETREFCDFVKGFFHEEATLCSQVSCMGDICGMISFYSREIPDQFYRLWTPIFLHAGVIQLIFSVVYQLYIMRDVEKYIGPFRIGIIYMVSGISGYLASAIFLPYRADVGPGGAQFGILASLFIEIYANWKYVEESKERILSLVRLIMVTIFLFIMGLLPWFDNYAHLFGFITGFFLSLALHPYLALVSESESYNRKRKIIRICLSLIVVVIIMLALFIILYIYPIYDCSFCKYLTCIPFTKNWCSDTNQDIKITRQDIL